MPKDRRESNRKYYEKHTSKAKRKKYRRRAKIKAKKRARGPYMWLSDKQRKFKKSVDQGIDPVEAVKRAYPGITNIPRKLGELKQHPAIAISLDKFMAELEDVGLTIRYEAKKYKEMTDISGKAATPHVNKVASGILMHLDKLRGFEVERKESRSLNINITMTEEQMEFFLRKQGEMEKRKEEAIDGQK